MIIMFVFFMSVQCVFKYIAKCGIMKLGVYSQLWSEEDTLPNYKLHINFPFTVILWNSLPPTVINSPTLNQFCNNFYDQYLCVIISFE